MTLILLFQLQLVSSICILRYGIDQSTTRKSNFYTEYLCVFTVIHEVKYKNHQISAPLDKPFLQVKVFVSN